MESFESSGMTQEEVTEAAEHRDAKLDVRAILGSQPGRRFFKYLFKYYNPIELPPLGLEGNILHEGLGQLRAYNEIFKLVAEADPSTAALLLAENEKERYAKLVRDKIDSQG